MIRIKSPIWRNYLFSEPLPETLANEEQGSRESLLEEENPDVSYKIQAIYKETDFKAVGKTLLNTVHDLEFIRKDFTVEDLAEASGLDSQLVKHYFSSYAKTDFRNWKKIQRIDIMKRLLLEKEDVPIADLIEQTGYKEKSSFYRNFRQQVGCTPKQWRECNGNLHFLEE